MSSPRTMSKRLLETLLIPMLTRPIVIRVALTAPLEWWQGDGMCTCNTWGMPEYTTPVPASSPAPTSETQPNVVFLFWPVVWLLLRRALKAFCMALWSVFLPCEYFVCFYLNKELRYPPFCFIAWNLNCDNFWTFNFFWKEQLFFAFFSFS